ncbi:MAG: hypothetical protein O7F73_20165 [Gammaproteobacteria bacterium]|nr:hypothetical protein [Gammaproteobacteria bacterium]
MIRVLICTFLLVAVAGCGSSGTPEEQAQLFCDTLERVNSGGMNTDSLPELAGHAKVLRTLLDVAPAVIEGDLRQFHAIFASWAGAVSGDNPMLQTFRELSDPSLAGAEGRIGDYIADACGLRIGDGSYVEADRPSAQDICPGWPRIGSPLTFNNFPNLPDISGANYFANDFMMSRVGLALGDAFAVEPGGWVELHGQYPRARYFAYHPNDFDLNNLKTLRDVDLDPDPGSVNPFREVPAPGSKNYYTAKLVFTAAPDAPESNTSYVGVKKDGESSNRYLFNMLRLYASDIGDGPNSGGVPLPAVTIYAADGSVSQHFEECDLYAEGRPLLKTDLKFPELPIADHRARRTPVWSSSSNFDAPSDTLANADVQYLSTVYSRRFGNIFVLRAKYLTAPNTRSGEPVSTPGYDVRLYTLCNYNIWAGNAIDCMLDTELKVGDDGYYTLVISDQENRPGNLAAEQATWMDWGPFLDGQISFRHVFRENPRVSEIAAALDGTAVSESTQPYVPIALPCNTSTFEQGGWEACLGAHRGHSL